MKENQTKIDRRVFLKTTSMGVGALALGGLGSGCASAANYRRPSRLLETLKGSVINLEIGETALLIGGEEAIATTVNGGIPGPLIRLKEGQDAVLRVKNNLEVDSSIHWHGLLVPPDMDGVPGVSFDGIKPGETFEYRFPVRHAGTYWYHSHSGFQEQTGVYGPIIIDPKNGERHDYDREYTIILSDWTFEDPEKIFSNLKRGEGYYNYQRRTLANFGEESAAMGLWGAIKNRTMWAGMRMDSTDLSDVTGATYTYLMNGLAPSENWRGLFSPGEKIRLRFINAGAATYFDVRIPGLKMTVIQADGQDVVPVETEEFRIANAETYDVIIEPKKSAYTIFAEAKDRSGFCRGTISVDAKTNAPVPNRRPRPLLTMADMGMAMNMSMDKDNGSGKADMKMAGMKMPSMNSATNPIPDMKTKMCGAQIAVMAEHNDDGHGAGNTAVAEMAMSKITDPGVGLRDAPWNVLTYDKLRRAIPGDLYSKETHMMKERVIELHLTGNMERYMWSFNGEAFYKGMPTIKMKLGERIRFLFINDTMMAHPIHIHGMFFELEVGACESNPLKHTVNVKPAERSSFTLVAEEVGKWAFHCHILYHMDAGMFRVVEVVR